ncbi:hypothetical protein FVEN_g8053 [Fusarium venenatum]|nr:hypothetical protein FVEN_g8053 [Fusarium venenatum]
MGWPLKGGRKGTTLNDGVGASEVVAADVDMDVDVGSLVVVVEEYETSVIVDDGSVDVVDSTIALSVVELVSVKTSSSKVVVVVTAPVVVAASWVKIDVDAETNVELKPSDVDREERMEAVP